MRLYSFEKLEVWQLSKELTADIYRLSAGFPSEEKFGITSQLRRASFSVANNLAEGSSRRTPNDRKRFIEIAYGSLMETLNILLICEELKLIDGKSLEFLRPKIEKISNKLTALRNSIK